MSLPALSDPPCDIVAQALIDLGMGVTPPSIPWPVGTAMEIDQPDDVITVYDTEGISHGRSMQDGENVRHRGFQVRIRATDYVLGFQKAESISNAMDALKWKTVTVSGNTYTIWSMNRSSGILSLGLENPTSARVLFTVNALMAVKQN